MTKHRKEKLSLTSHRKDARAVGDRGGRRDRRRSLMFSALEIAQETFFVFFFRTSLIFSALKTFRLAV